MFNRIVLMGRLTKDPEIRTTQSGITMCRFSIAVDRSYSKGQEKQTDFLDITAWRNTAEFVSKYFAKGRMILIEGKLQNDNYTDQSGKKVYRNTIIADSVSFCGDKSGNQQNTGQSAPPAQQPYQNQYQQSYTQNQNYQQPYQNQYQQPYQNQGYAQPQQNYTQPQNNQQPQGGYSQPQQSYGAPAQNQPPQAYQQNNMPPPDISADNDFSEFEELLSDGEVPF